MTAEEVAEKFPDAVAIARQFKEVFGDGVRLLFARNARGRDSREARPQRHLLNNAFAWSASIRYACVFILKGKTHGRRFPFERRL